MSAEVVSKIRRTLSEVSEGLLVQNPLDFLQRTSQLYYTNDGDMKEIRKQLSAPAGWSIPGADSGSLANGHSSPDNSNEDQEDSDFAQYISDSSGSRMAVDCDMNGSDEEDSAAHYHYFTEISTESEISNYEDDPESFLDSASGMYFEEEEAGSDSECRIKEDGIAINNLAVSGLPFLEPARGLLEKCEKIVMKAFGDHLKAFDVQLEDGAIHTLHVCDDLSNCPKSQLSIPLVMVHGMGGAIPAFYKNYRDLARGRCVFGIDMPGFGLSTRVDFPTDPEECEKKMVEMIEQWRQKVDINKMILLGHSFGGYISALYALRHPQNVQNLVLLEPWGVFSKDDDKSIEADRWRNVAMYLCNKMKTQPFSMFTCFGYLLGNSIMKMFNKEDRKIYGKTCMNYLVRLNTTGKPTGCKAFTIISNFTFKYPKTSLRERLLDPVSKGELKLPLTLVCGHKSACHQNIQLNEVKSSPPYLHVHSIYEAEHHVQVEKPSEFTKLIIENVYSK